MEEAVSRLRLEGHSSDSEEENEEIVELGFFQETEHPWRLERQHFPCKAGGAAAWLDPQNLPRLEDAQCGICAEPLQFLLQVYAPLDEREDTFHRTLFVFMCTKMSCLKVHENEQGKREPGRKARRSIKVFRSQLPRQNAFYSDRPPEKEQHLPLTPGANLCSWCGTWRGEKLCGGCRRMRYCSRQHQVAHWHLEHSFSCKAIVQDATQNRKLWSNKLWKEFEIVLDEERYEEDTSKNQLQLIPQAPDALDAELQGFQEASREKQCWASFQARIAIAPTQVLRYESLVSVLPIFTRAYRYCRKESAKPLWVKLDGQVEPSKIGHCQHCSASRMFEFQILPQVLYYFGVENEPDSLDWGTVVVYSCAESCPVSGYAEESAWVQL